MPISVFSVDLVSYDFAEALDPKAGKGEGLAVIDIEDPEHVVLGLELIGSAPQKLFI